MAGHNAKRMSEEGDLLRVLGSSIGEARDAILAKQFPGGYWHAPLEANVGMDAQYVVFNRFELERRGGRWRIARRTTRMLGHDEAHALFTRALHE